jgi:hypothetical protein
MSAGISPNQVMALTSFRGYDAAAIPANHPVLASTLGDVPEFTELPRTRITSYAIASREAPAS